MSARSGAPKDRALAAQPDWNAITPESLRRPVRVIRERFSALANAERDRHWKGFRSSIQSVPAVEAPSFSQHFMLLEMIVGKKVKEAFDSFLQIAQVNAPVLKLSPIDWAHKQVESLVATETEALRNWIMHVCDGPVGSRTSWRAPKWLTWAFDMPDRSDYDPRSAWLRQDQTTTSQVLGRLTERFERELQARLKDAGDEASVRLAGTPQAVSHGEVVPRRGFANRKRSKREIRRDCIFFGALQAGLRGRKYCEYLDAQNIFPLQEWKSEGCPAKYSTAYMSGPPWRKKIQDQKHRYQIRYNRLSKAEREGLIQTAN